MHKILLLFPGLILSFSFFEPSELHYFRIKGKYDIITLIENRLGPEEERLREEGNKVFTRLLSLK